jgi:hypothetical protein
MNGYKIRLIECEIHMEYLRDTIEKLIEENIFLEKEVGRYRIACERTKIKENENE